MDGRRPTILLTGASGFLGGYLTAELRARGLPFLRAGRRSEDQIVLDLEEPSSIRSAVRESSADLVIHAAAQSSLAACEAAPHAARLINHEATARLAAEAGRRLVFVSTDLVFSGTSAPYRADAEPLPLSVYGTTKALAEGAVLAASGLVVRIPLLFGRSADGRRGATDMIRRAEDPIELYTNEIRTPLHAADAARGILDLALARDGVAVLHVAGPETLSRFDLGRRFLAASGLSGITLRAIECADPLRPRDVSLVSDWDCHRSLDEALAES